MSRASHQTIRLSPGKHSSPEDGACVMELASLLAGEPFTDHPACTCPVIGSFLRSYNDLIDDDRRQDLYRYAALVVGSRGSAEVQRLRAERLAEWSSSSFFSLYARLLPDWLARAMARLRKPPLAIEALGASAARSVPRHTAQTHAQVLDLIDELLAIGDRRPPARAVEVPESGELLGPDAQLLDSRR